MGLASVEAAFAQVDVPVTHVVLYTQEPFQREQWPNLIKIALWQGDLCGVSLH